MKKLLLLSMTLFVGFFSIPIMGQNKCTVGNTTVYSSENVICCPLGDDAIATVALPKTKKTVDFCGRDMFALSVEPTFECNHIGIWSDNGFEYWENVSSANVEVPEGHYSVSLTGSDDEGFILLAYEIDVHENTSLSPEASEATTYFVIEAEDENGNNLYDAPLGIDSRIFVDYYWKGDYSYGISQTLSPNPFKYNFIPDDCFIVPVGFYYTTEGQKEYCIRFDTIFESSNGHTINHGEDLLTLKQYYHFSDSDSTACFNMNYRVDFGNNGWSKSTHGAGRDASFDEKIPLSIITNIKDDHPERFEPKEMKYRIFPIVYESLVHYDMLFHDDFTHSAMSINADGQFVREPFDEILNQDLRALYHQSYPNHIPLTPALMAMEPNESHYIGFRTPMWYFQGIGFSSNGPMGFPFYGGILCSFGEEGVMRPMDDELLVNVIYNGEDQIYHDSIYLFNWEWNFVSPGEGVIAMDVENNRVENQGLVMANRTHIEFDLSKDDAYPPTMTILQVVNQNGKESIDIHNLNNSSINIAAGDFIIDMDIVQQQINCMNYFDKPEIEVWYSIDGANYEPLEVYEDESMFHVNYGNFFVVDLGQLEGIANDKWVSLKVTVTDAQGNFQTQELDNLFYAGQFTSINEDMMTSKNHTVHPNPFTDEVRITTADAVNGAANVQVYNVLGAQVYQQTVNCTDAKEFTIDGSALKPGIYFYSINTENGLMQGRIVKE